MKLLSDHPLEIFADHRDIILRDDGGNEILLPPAQIPAAAAAIVGALDALDPAAAKAALATLRKTTK